MARHVVSKEVEVVMYAKESGHFSRFMLGSAKQKFAKFPIAWLFGNVCAS